MNANKKNEKRITDFDVLYATLGYKGTYQKHEVKSVIDVEAFRKDRNHRPRVRSIYLGTTSLLGDQEADTIDEMFDVIKGQLKEAIDESMKCNSYTSPSNFSLLIDAEEDEVELIFEEEIPPEPETNNQTIARLVRQLHSRSKKDMQDQERRMRENQIKQEQLKQFNVTVGNMNIDDSQKQALLEQFKKDNGID